MKNYLGYTYEIKYESQDKKIITRKFLDDFLKFDNYLSKISKDNTTEYQQKLKNGEIEDVCKFTNYIHTFPEVYFLTDLIINRIYFAKKYFDIYETDTQPQIEQMKKKIQSNDKYCQDLTKIQKFAEEPLSLLEYMDWYFYSFELFVAKDGEPFNQKYLLGGRNVYGDPLYRFINSFESQSIDTEINVVFTAVEKGYKKSNLNNYNKLNVEILKNLKGYEMKPKIETVTKEFINKLLKELKIDLPLKVDEDKKIYTREMTNYFKKHVNSQDKIINEFFQNRNSN